MADIDHLEGSPDTSTYANTSDIVWMKWIKEDHQAIIYSKADIPVYYSITKVTKSTVDGESYYRIPSRAIRDLLDIKQFNDPEFLNSVEDVVSFIYKKSDGDFKDDQEIVLSDQSLLLAKLKENGLRLFWILEIFKRKNPLNKDFEHCTHTQKTRKYLIWKQGDNLQSLKFWDEYFSNQRDKKQNTNG